MIILTYYLYSILPFRVWNYQTKSTGMIMINVLFSNLIPMMLQMIKSRSWGIKVEDFQQIPRVKD